MGARRGCADAYASERKILLVSDVIAIVKAKHVELSKQGSAAAFDLSFAPPFLSRIAVVSSIAIRFPNNNMKGITPPRACSTTRTVISPVPLSRPRLCASVRTRRQLPRHCCAQPIARGPVAAVNDGKAKQARLSPPAVRPVGPSHSAAAHPAICPPPWSARCRPARVPPP